MYYNNHTFHPTKAFIRLDSIRHNLEQIKKKVSPALVMGIVKANAYGHGIKVISKELVSAGVNYLGVGHVAEGLSVRELEKEIPILVLSPLFPEEVLPAIKVDLEITVVSLESALSVSQTVAETGKRAIVHIKIDTGMHRLGIPWENSSDVIEKISLLPNIQIKGIFTHLATADEKDKQFAELQLKRFDCVCEAVESTGIRIPLKHAANSAAILDLPNSYYDIVRPGICLYGYYPSRETSKSIFVKPVMTLKSRVRQLRFAKKGESLSYGQTYRLPESTYVAAIPVGYADGYNRLLSNKGSVMINEKKYPVIGTVCMDWILVDAGDAKGIKEGDEVLLFGRQNGSEISIWEMCDHLNTIPYEILCNITPRVPREYI